jgi:prepilin-type N-terminal cleavage/methylation domain-containing protein
MKELQTMNGRNCRGGFTLIELLVVIGIIVALAGMTIGAVMYARTGVSTVPILMEMSQMQVGMARVAMELGGGQYPPAGAGDAAAYWKRTGFPGTPPADASDPQKALYFWLNGAGGNTTPLFDFDANRVKNGMYYPFPGATDPYVYFGPDPNTGTYGGQGGTTGAAKPYSSAAGTPINPRTCQLLAPGVDGKYGTNGSKYPPAAVDDLGADDLANFSTSTMQNAMSQ